MSQCKPARPRRILPYVTTSGRCVSLVALHLCVRRSSLVFMVFRCLLTCFSSSAPFALVYDIRPLCLSFVSLLCVGCPPPRMSTPCGRPSMFLWHLVPFSRCTGILRFCPLLFCFLLYMHITSLFDALSVSQNIFGPFGYTPFYTCPSIFHQYAAPHFPPPLRRSLSIFILPRNNLSFRFVSLLSPLEIPLWALSLQSVKLLSSFSSCLSFVFVHLRVAHDYSPPVISDGRWLPIQPHCDSSIGSRDSRLVCSAQGVSRTT